MTRIVLATAGLGLDLVVMLVVIARMGGAL